MRKSLLLLFGLFASVSVFAQSDFFAWGGRFDDLELGTTFPMVTAKGDAVLDDAVAVVVADPLNPSNKVLHVTTGATAGLVQLDNPGNVSASNVLKKYKCVSVKFMRPADNEAADGSDFELYFAKYYAYNGNKVTALEADKWTSCLYSPLALERNTLSKTYQIGLLAANADYYIDDICFMCASNAFDLYEAALEQARKDSIWAIEKAKRDEVMKEQEEAYDRMLADINKNMDRDFHLDFEDYPVGTEFPVYPKKGDDPIEGAKAVVELDGNNKVLHVTTPVEGGYVEFDNYNGMSASNVLKKFKNVCIQIKRASGETATASSNFEIVFGGYYAHNAAPSVALTAGKWVTNTYAMALERNSLSKKMRIGLVAAGADYYIDNIYYPHESYDRTFTDKTKTARYWADMMGKNVGTCVNPGISNNDDFGKTASNNFNMVVCENATKFDATEPSRNNFNWQADGVVNYALQNNMKVRGHTLAWHGQNPDWVSNYTGSREEMVKILKNHIYNVVGHWKGKISEWDVVNECLEENVGRAVGAGYSTRSYSVWYQGFGGEDYIDSAFVWAHQADPDAKLYINDYNIGHWGGGHYENGKTHAMYNLAKRLKDAGIPIDGVGMQMHTSVSGLQPAQIEETVRQFREIGLNCIITEMDMPGGETSDGKCTRPISNAELQTQAEKYGEIARIMAKYDNTPTFVVWGLVDNRSWLDGSEGTKPLLFFADYSPHPAYIEVRKAYQRMATVVTEVEDVFADTFENSDPTWFGFDEKKVDVYNLLGQKIATGISSDQIYDLPEGLYIIDGKKVLVRE